MKDKEWGEWKAHLPDEVRTALHRLETGNVKECWPDGIPRGLLWKAAVEYEVCIQHGTWERKTQRERDLWLENYRKTVAYLIDLMNDGPRPPDSWGFPVRDTALVKMASHIGLEVPSSAEHAAYFKTILKLEDSVDDCGWTIVDALNHYSSQIEVDCKPSQVIKKPGDVKAGRAKFIIRFRESTKLSTAAVALVASLMFDDEAIDDRLVRRLTSQREDS